MFTRIWASWSTWLAVCFTLAAPTMGQSSYRMLTQQNGYACVEAGAVFLESGGRDDTRLFSDAMGITTIDAADLDEGSEAGFLIDGSIRIHCDDAINVRYFAIDEFESIRMVAGVRNVFPPGAAMSELVNAHAAASSLTLDSFEISWMRNQSERLRWGLGYRYLETNDAIATSVLSMTYVPSVRGFAAAENTFHGVQAVVDWTLFSHASFGIGPLFKAGLFAASSEMAAGDLSTNQVLGADESYVASVFDLNLLIDWKPLDWFGIAAGYQLIVFPDTFRAEDILDPNTFKYSFGNVLTVGSVESDAQLFHGFNVTAAIVF